MSGLKILLIDDDDDVLNLLSHNFTKNGHIVKCAHNGIEGIEKFNLFQPDAIIVDLIMPEMDGIEFTQTIRSLKTSIKPIAILIFSGRSEDYSQIAALDAGADDYVVKPIRFKILESKIISIVKRYKNVSEINPLLIDSVIEQDTVKFVDNNKVVIGGQLINLANKEYQLLALLCSQPKKIFTREEIYRLLWKKTENTTLRTIDVHIRKLRDKTQLDCIKTLKGVGYKIEL
jgi:two-component system, OmpR family, alkaline phosphatase synthesis response regulator PhoP